MVALALVLSGRAHFTPECATHGGPQWRVLTSPHFLVRTNLARPEARKATLDLERARSALLPTLHGVPEGGPRLEVLLLGNSMQVEDLTATYFVDSAIAHDWRGPLLVVSGGGYLLDSNVELKLLLRGLALHYQSFSFRRSPRWFALGLAEYLSTITIDETDNTAYRGAMGKEQVEAVQHWGALSVEKLWAWDQSSGRLGLEWHRISSAWFWVHFFLNEHRDEFQRFMHALEEGEEPRGA